MRTQDNCIVCDCLLDYDTCGSNYCQFCGYEVTWRQERLLESYKKIISLTKEINMAIKLKNGLEFYGSNVVFFNDEDGIEVGHGVPQTNGCYHCDMAYADPDDFMCPGCASDIHSLEQYKGVIAEFMKEVSQHVDQCRDNFENLKERDDDEHFDSCFPDTTNPQQNDLDDPYNDPTNGIEYCPRCDEPIDKEDRVVWNNDIVVCSECDRDATEQERN